MLALISAVNHQAAELEGLLTRFRKTALLGLGEASYNRTCQLLGGVTEEAYVA